MDNQRRHMLPNSIVCIGRRWFDRHNGNTYHSVEVVIDGRSRYNSGIEYGYEDAYITTAIVWIEKEFGLTMRQLRDLDVVFFFTVSEVKSKGSL